MLRPPPVSTLFPYTTLFRSVEAMRRGQTKYTDVAGIPELRRAVCAKFKRDNGLEYEPADVLVACGAKHVLFNMVRSEEHTSELQSHSDLVCRLLLEKKKKTA